MEISLPEFAPRLDFGRPLEPAGRVLQGAGQDRAAWLDYRGFMASAGLRPEMFMAYAGLRGLTRARLESLRAYWDESPESPPLLQLGLSMTRDGQPEHCYAHEVAAGQHDPAIRLLGDFFATEGRPVLLRVGYECTGPWNGYEPQTYVAAFRRVAGMLREFPFALATVWCVEGGWTAPAADYYPGDEWVDWFSVDLFAPDHFAGSEGFMRMALEHARPVLVGECTPRRVGVLAGADSWKAWFGPFFEWIARHAQVKGFSYINWDWSAYPQWSDWGDARLQANPFVLDQWIRHIRALEAAGAPARAAD
jgi:hypothetical protein